MQKKQKNKPSKAKGRHLKRLLVFTSVAAIVVGFYFSVVRYEPKVYGSEWSVSSTLDTDSMLTLTLDEGQESLKIMQLADLQMKFGDFLQDRKTMSMLGKALDKEQPDICVATGDLVFSIFNEGAITYFAKYMEEREQYWSFAFGNHDSEVGIDKYRISEMLKDYKYCLYEVGPDSIKGKGNYFVNINDSQGNLVYALSMLDSNMYTGRSYTNGKYSKYDSIAKNQVQWYKWTVEGLQKEKADIQSLAFFHIPTIQFMDLYETGVYEGEILEPKRSDGKAGIHHQAQDNDFFKTVKELGSTKGFFVGHDHASTMRGWYDGVYLCYGKTGGYHTYPFFEEPNLLTNIFGLSDSTYFNAELIGGRGSTIINVDLTDAKYGELDVYDVLYSTFE